MGMLFCPIGGDTGFCCRTGGPGFRAEATRLAFQDCRYFRDGSFAQKLHIPTENALSLGNLEPERLPYFCLLAPLLVPYGGFLAGNLQAAASEKREFCLTLIEV